ncbi:MAG: HPr family phosphocarrier protein, partial [Planctomycetota bacterium]
SITNEEFKELIDMRSQPLLGLVNYLRRCQPGDNILTRPLLGQLLSQSRQLEELLDAYDASNNCQWCIFRSLMAAFKSFSDLSYELLHIDHSRRAYRLLPIDEDFELATRKALEFTENVILCAAGLTVSVGQKLGLAIPPYIDCHQIYKEDLPSGRLPRDCKAVARETASESLTLISTAFLNLAAESEQICAAGRAQPSEYDTYLTNSVTEEKLRGLELRFHNMQSMYDTYVSGTNAETKDKDLGVLRGHISVVFHLLRTATALAHYYERHVTKPMCTIQYTLGSFVEKQALLEMLMKYSLNFINQYVGCAQRLCQEMLKRYSVIESIEVPVPVYRGFHVRPSTLISKLVLHYGCDVRMEIEDESYDASSSLELFRANEKINAKKRRWLAQQIISAELVPHQADLTDADITEGVRSIVLTLAEQGKLILYEQPLEVPQTIGRGEGTLLEKVNDGIAQLLAVGKIDIATDIKAIFIGDKRVLADIKLLTENGYGEDSFGNNIPLPHKLEYLRR